MNFCIVTAWATQETIAVNFDHISSFRSSGGGTVLYFATFTPALTVKETFDEIVDMMEGDEGEDEIPASPCWNGRGN